jgi:hypothetical protein
MQRFFALGSTLPLLANKGRALTCHTDRGNIKRGLKGLGHEIKLKYFDKNIGIFLGLNRDLCWFLVF